MSKPRDSRQKDLLRPPLDQIIESTLCRTFSIASSSVGTESEAARAIWLVELRISSRMVSFSFLGLQHPEPSGPRRATPTSNFQHPAGYSRAGARSEICGTLYPPVDKCSQGPRVQTMSCQDPAHRYVAEPNIRAPRRRCDASEVGL